MANTNDISFLQNMTAGQQQGAQLGTQFGQLSGVGQFKETPFTRLTEAMNRLRQAEATISSIAVKLVGEQTVDSCRDASKPIGSGIFGSIEEMADGVAALAADIIDHASRIERRL